MKYTEEQEKIARHEAKRLLVSSLAGTGKTETVAYRITKLLEKKKSVLCLTFTNAAVLQLTNRLTKKGLIDQVQVSTLDSYTANLLKPYGIKVSDCLNVIRSVFQSYGLKTNLTNLRDFQKLSSFNYFQKSETDVIISGLAPQTVVDLFGIYDSKKRESGLIDFSDATILATELVKQQIDTFGYDEIIVDEAQDLNPLQMAFILELAKNCNLTFVGDKNQSIYAFAGVSADLFETACEGWDELFLSQSFRSAKNIIDVVNMSISELSTKELKTDIEGGIVEVGDVETSDLFIEKHIKDKPAVLGSNRNALIPTANRFESKGYKVWRSWIDDKETMNDYDIIFTSIHKAKGLEFKSVIVKNVPEYSFRGVDGDRLLYVALSRAEQNLFIEKAGERLPAILEGVENGK